MKKMKKPLKANNSMKISDFFSKQGPKNNGTPVSSSQASPKDKKRKIDDPLSASCSKRPNMSKNVDENASTPSKSRIAVKTPEKLLTPDALLALNRTPTKAVTPRALFKEDFVSPARIALSNRTPNKSSSKKNYTDDQITPSKNRRTPKKLFQKSPKNLHEFNIEVISDFIKITPSKCMQKAEDDECVTINSGEKRQISILKYLSPKQSQSAKKAQFSNEMTPTKETLSPSLVVGRARTKIDFSDQSNGNRKDIPTNTKENSLNLSNIDYDFNDSWDGMIDTVYNLDLSELQYCKIMGIKEDQKGLVLTVKSINDENYGICSLQGFWSQSMLKVEDTIRIKAEQNRNGDWFVNNEAGYLVYEPDVLLSTTSIVGAVFCKRKTVLVDKFRTSSAGNKFMLVGTLVHSIFQTALKSKINKEKDIVKIANNLIRSKSMLKSFYECNVRMKEIEKEVMDFVPKIAQFVDGYLFNKKSSDLKRIKDNWQGNISSISDIEENIWCPQLGFKGKIDVSVMTNGDAMKPLELKTGKASVSLEHRGQIIMYIMMLNQLGVKVPSGLLLYLKEGILREIPVTENEKRDLIILRNELTFYLTSQPTVLKNNDDIACIKPAILPEPINSSFCDKCEYSTECVAFLKYNKQESNKNLRKIQENQLAHLSQSHLEYFMLWSSLLALEANSQDERKHVRNIYTLLPEDREKNGTCIPHLQVISVEEVSNELYEHTFKKAGGFDEANNSRNFLFSSIIQNKYVVVSTNTRPAVSAGFVTEISPDEISITLDRNILQKHPANKFHVDMYDSNTIQSFNQSNLTLLLQQSERADELRQIIIEKRLPTFETKLSKIIITKGAAILKRLNNVQQRAVLKALAAKDYLLIKGMPGTGKTETIVALIQLLESLGKTVLLTSHTHTAVDNVCLRLIKYGVKLMRLGSNMRIDSNLKPFSEHTLTENCTTTEKLELVYKTPNVLAVTCLGANHPILLKRTMDVCIVDESTQVLQCSVLKTLFAAKTFILIGDPDQLPAVVRNKTALAMGMSESLFDRLNKEEATIALNLNYRMNDPITNLANVLTYNGELLVANEVVAKATLKLPNYESFKSHYANEEWILNVLQTRLESAVCFVNIGPVWKMESSVPWLLSNNIHKSEEFQSQKCVNIYEAALVYSIVTALIEGGVNSDEIGVITTYRAQVAQIAFLLKSVGVVVSTVDQYQGKDKNVIIYSCVKSEDISKGRDTTYDLLSDKRRLNVAITRAKHKLILIGDVSTLDQYSTFSKIISSLERNTIVLKDNKDGFYWNNVLDIKTES